MTQESVEERARRLVEREVHACLSSLVATLAGGYGVATGELGDLAEQAFELARPVEDWEEAARQAGWTLTGGVWTHNDFENAETTADAACYRSNADPYEWEIFEHWAVSGWLGEKLADKGERVDTDFGGLVVWGRQTTGQAIYADGVIEAIAKDCLALVEA